MTKELGDEFYTYPEESIKKMYDFGCSIGESEKGISLKTFDKWMSMWLFMKE